MQSAHLDYLCREFVTCVSGNPGKGSSSLEQRVAQYHAACVIIIASVLPQFSENGTTIKLHNVNFEASGTYSCEVTMTTPIYTAGAEPVQMKVIGE